VILSSDLGLGNPPEDFNGSVSSDLGLGNSPEDFNGSGKETLLEDLSFWITGLDCTRLTKRLLGLQAFFNSWYNGLRLNLRRGSSSSSLRVLFSASLNICNIS